MNLKTVLVNPGNSPQVANVIVQDDEYGLYDSFREILGRSLDLSFPLRDTVMLINNEYGKELGMPANRKIHSTGPTKMDYFIYGPFYLCGLNDESRPCSLTDQQVEACMKLLESAELPPSEHIA